MRSAPAEPAPGPPPGTAAPRCAPWKRRLALSAAAALAAIWFWSAASKWGVPKAVELFGVIRDVFPWIPAGLVERFARVLPALELALGCGLVLPWTRRWAAAGSALLLAGFTLFLAKAWTMGYQESCGCFGAVVSLTSAEARLVYGLAVVRNCGLLVLAACLCRGTAGTRELMPGRNSSAGRADGGAGPAVAGAGWETCAIGGRSPPAGGRVRRRPSPPPSRSARSPDA